MKRYFKLFVVLLIAVLFVTGCGANNNERKAKNSEDVKQKSSKKWLERTQIEEKVIVDSNGVKVTAKSISYNGYFGPEIKVLIENSTDKSLMIQSRNFSINGIMIEPTFSADVAAGKKANDTITIDAGDLKAANITAIKDIEFDVAIIDGDTWDTVATVPGVKLQTDAKDYVQKYNTDGVLAVDQNNIKVYVLKVDDKNSYIGKDIYLYVENNTGRTITVQTRDVSVNGFMLDPVFSSTITAGKKCYDTMSFLESDLKDNDIKDINEIELKFVAYDDESYDEILSTDVKKISFE